MGRPKGSKNKKTIAKELEALANEKLLGENATQFTDNVNSGAPTDSSDSVLNAASAESVG